MRSLLPPSVKLVSWRWRAWTTPLSNQISAKFLNRPLFFTSDTPHNQILASSGLSESCPKIGDVPKFPFHTVAALVPSAGTITHQIELHSDARAISTRPLPRPRAACGARPLIERKPPSRHSIRRPDRKGPGISGPTTNSFRNNDRLSNSARLFDEIVGGHE
jgi:hypothetical protein